MIGEQLQQLIDSAPNFKSANGANPYNCTTIDLTNYNEEINLSNPIIIRKNKSILIYGGPHSSTRINAPKNKPCFIIEPGHRVAKLEGLLLCGGGVQYIDKVNKHWGMKDCTVIDANCAVEILGQGSVGGYFDNIYFRNCIEDIKCLKGQNNLIVFNRCFFLQTSGSVSTTLASTHFTFRDCSWERSSTFACIHLADNNESTDKSSIASFTTFDNCRWGPEKPTPNHIFVIGGKPYTMEFTPTNLYNIKISGDMRGYKTSQMLKISPNSVINF